MGKGAVGGIKLDVVKHCNYCETDLMGKERLDCRYCPHGKLWVGGMKFDGCSFHQRGGRLAAS